MNLTRETVEPAMREAAKDVCGEDMMVFVPAETRNLMVFYASLRKLLVEVLRTKHPYAESPPSAHSVHTIENRSLTRTLN